jgi:NitT/TauT family transport system substrate-binding protein
MKLKILIAATAAAFMLGGSFGAQAADDVSLRLNWYLGGLHVPFYYGKELGLYEQEGINLTINEGRGSGNTTQVIAAGSDTFGLADSSSLISLAAKGAEIQSVMSLLNSTGFAVVSLAETGIRTPKDLEGKSVAVSPGDPLAQLLEAVAKANDVDISTINFVQVDPAAKVVSVLEKRVDALLGGADDQYFLIKYQGQEPHALRYSEHGANIVGMTVLTQTDLIENNPDLVERFVRASAASWKAAMENPEAAVEAALKIKPDLNQQSTLDQMKVDFELLHSTGSPDRVGFGSEADWAQTIDLLKTYRGLETDADWTTFHTNAFVPE